MNEEERAEQVLHCRYVDQVVVRSPWVLTQEFLDEHEIDFVVHGEDNSYDESGNDAYAFVKAQGKYKTIKRTDGVSTTDLIIRVLKDYNGYVERCMRRGFTHQDLNIPENVWVRALHNFLNLPTFGLTPLLQGRVATSHQSWQEVHLIVPPHPLINRTRRPPRRNFAQPLPFPTPPSYS